MLNIYLQDGNEKELDFDELRRMEKEVLQYENISLEKLDDRLYYKVYDDFKRVCTMQQEDGSFPLAINCGMPSDCYYHYVGKPTYIILKLMIEYGELAFYENIQKAIAYGKKRRFGSSGFDFLSDQLSNMKMLLRAGILKYADDETKQLFKDVYDNARERVRMKQTKIDFGDYKNDFIELIKAYQFATQYRHYELTVNVDDIKEALDAIKDNGGIFDKMVTRKPMARIYYRCDKEVKLED